jgi:hypothetical protein
MRHYEPTRYLCRSRGLTWSRLSESNRRPSHYESTRPATYASTAALSPAETHLPRDGTTVSALHQLQPNCNRPDPVGFARTDTKSHVTPRGSRLNRPSRPVRLGPPSIELRKRPETRLDENAYAASVGGLLDIIRSLDDELDTVVLVGHNPGLEGLAETLIGDWVHLPTSALAVIELNGPWRSAGHVRGLLTRPGAHRRTEKGLMRSHQRWLTPPVTREAPRQANATGSRCVCSPRLVWVDACGRGLQVVSLTRGHGWPPVV